MLPRIAARVRRIVHVQGHKLVRPILAKLHRRHVGMESATRQRIVERVLKIVLVRLGRPVNQESVSKESGVGMGLVGLLRTVRIALRIVPAMQVNVASTKRVRSIQASKAPNQMLVRNPMLENPEDPVYLETNVQKGIARSSTGKCSVWGAEMIKSVLLALVVLVR